MKHKLALLGSLAVLLMIFAAGCLSPVADPPDTQPFAVESSASDSLSTLQTDTLPETEEESFGESEALYETTGESTSGTGTDIPPATETIPLATESETDIETESECESKTETEAESDIKTETDPPVPPPHDHTFSTTWTHDESGHWHAAICDHEVTLGYASHRVDAGYVTTPATCTNEGARTYACVDCGRVLKTEAISVLAHTEIPDPRIEPTCTQTGLTEGTHCSVCQTVLTAQIVLPMMAHVETPNEEMPATCTTAGTIGGSHCAVCATPLTASTEIPPTGHTPVTAGDMPPTWDTEGSIGGTACGSCREVLMRGRTLPPMSAMNGRYGYETMGTMENGVAMQAFYERFHAAVLGFHTDPTQDAVSAAGLDNVVAYVNYVSLGLTAAEAQTVWNIYKSDNPLFYWISNRVAWSETDLYILTDPAFADGEIRRLYNDAIAESAVVLMTGLYSLLDELDLDMDPAYATALFFHNTIIAGMDYAFEEDGKIPQDDLWAHCIIGYFFEGYGVCESYARTYQLLLNYAGVENIFVIGIAGGGGHAWNLVRMGNGAWYWCDLTWNDAPDYPNGVVYEYFCVTDTEGMGFLDSHTPHTPSDSDINRQYPLPARADRPYTGYLPTDVAA